MKFNPMLVPLLLATGAATQVAHATTTKTIMEIQGAGAHSPLVNIDDKQYESKNEITTTGVITHIQQRPLGRDITTGFYIQDVKGDNNPYTSDALFVSVSKEQFAKLALKVGQTVRVTGKAKEHYGFTQLSAKDVNISDKSITKINATPVVLNQKDKHLSDALERYEGMRVSIDDSNKLFVSRNYGFDRKVRRNNLALSYQSINMQPNQQAAPSSQASKNQIRNIRNNELIVESFNKAAAGTIAWYPSFGQSTNGADYNYIRIGDSVNSMAGIVGYSHGNYRLFVESTANKETFAHHNPRTSAPSLKDGDIKVATFNVLNYFNSPFGGDANPLSQNRGAKTQAEFEMQRAKIVKAILALDADIIGLMEIENNGTQTNSALQDLLNHINKHLPLEKRYQFASNGQKYNGTGAITSQVIYRPSKMSVANFQVINMPQQDAPEVGKENGKNFMRNAVTPTFKLTESGESLTVSVNHFKSKGSTCWEDVALQDSKDVDQQGSCEHFRVSGAYHLGKTLAKIDGHKLIIGDLNAYALEDPLSVLTNRQHLPQDYVIRAARNTYIGGNSSQGQQLHGDDGAIINQSFGYINTVRELHPDAFGYSFSNVVGTLDYVLASPSLKSHIVDVTEWNINSPESTLFEYGTRYTGDMKKFADVYRSSDHDPVIISLDFGKTQEQGKSAEKASDDKQSGGAGIIMLIAGFALVIRRKLIS
ncbi:MAG: ExeM/NucH family extracellular endonuclease [Psychrobium sp.]